MPRLTAHESPLSFGITIGTAGVGLSRVQQGPQACPTCVDPFDEQPGSLFDHYIIDIVAQHHTMSHQGGEPFTSVTAAEPAFDQGKALA